MNLRVTVSGKVKGHETCSRSESESEEGVESVLFELLKEAGTEKSKKIQRLIK